MRAHSTHATDLAEYGLVESNSSFLDDAVDRIYERAVFAEGRDRTKPGGALQSVHLRERRGFGGHRYAGCHGALLQLTKLAGQLHRAHENSEAVPQAGSGFPDQLVPSLATPCEQFPEQVRAHAGRRVPGGMVSHTE